MIGLAAVAIILADSEGQPATPTRKFKDEVEFLKKHAAVILLADETGTRQVAIVPAYQGRIMTSTADGPGGTSFGWVNRELIASGQKQEHINVYGGEDRFWLGPEGGQFSIFFAPGSPFDLEHWFTPAAIDTQPFEVASQSANRVVCRRRMQLRNYSGTTFDLEVSRELRLLDTGEAAKHLGLTLKPDLKIVAFESVNAIRNTGQEEWKKDTGLLSVWILGMLNASPGTTVVIPFRKGAASELGPAVNDAYFGKVPAERLRLKEGVLFFAADANYRSKIGISPRRARPILGSYDGVNHVLTLVQFTLPAGATEFVNSMWEIQKNPYAGDVVNSYNDGPPKPGAAQMGRFYELETSSPALALKPGQSATHVHRTIHLQGSEAELDPLARALLGVSLREIIHGMSR
jgi:hypothetical protein